MWIWNEFRHAYRANLSKDDVTTTNQKARPLLLDCPCYNLPTITPINSRIVDKITDANVWITACGLLRGPMIGLRINDLRSVFETHNIPLLRDNSHLSLLIAGFHFHDAPILLRWPATFADSFSTSSSKAGIVFA